MTNIPRFLETEAALKALADELKEIKTASGQIETAKETALSVVEMASAVSQNSAKLLDEFADAQDRYQTIQKSSSQKLKEIESQLNILDGKASEIAEAIKELASSLTAHAEIEKNQFDEVSKRDELFARALEQMSKTGQVTQIITAAQLALVVLALLSLLLPSVRAIFIK